MPISKELYNKVLELKDEVYLDGMEIQILYSN